MVYLELGREKYLSHILGMVLLPVKLITSKIDFSPIRLGSEMGTKNCKGLILFRTNFET